MGSSTTATPTLDQEGAQRLLPAPPSSPYYQPSLIDLRSIARPSTGKPSCSHQLQNTAKKIQNLLANPTPSRAEKSVRRSLDSDFQDSQTGPSPSPEEHLGGEADQLWNTMATPVPSPSTPPKDWGSMFERFWKCSICILGLLYFDIF